uniref:Uncharacterized protein n=1 Tax=Strigamia maritima TaxID=126957 RepID=T1JL83_STRMM
HKRHHISSLKMTDKWFSSCIAFISCFFLVYGQETTKVVDNKSQTQILYLKTTWDGHLLTNKTDIVPVSFCAQPSGDSKNIIVSFNSTGITNDEQKFFSPDVFGILFKGENNAILQVEVVKGGASKVELFYGFDKPLDPKAKLEVKYQEIPSKVANTTTWNASIEIPIEYFARGTNQLTAYTNFSQGPDHDV